MNLLFIRHAIAEDRYNWLQQSPNDDLRPLVKKGRKRFIKIASKLHSLQTPIDILIQSPLTRSQQTVDILKEIYKTPEVVTCSHLAPDGNLNKLTKFILNLNANHVAIVGHEPDLGCFLGQSLNVDCDLTFKKGEVALIQDFASATPKLKWKVPPKLFVQL